MTRQILILGAGIMQIPVMKTARSMGLKTLVFDGNPQAPGVPLADRFLPVDISREEDCLQAAKKIHEEDPLHGVITVGTDFSTTVSVIAQGLGLPGHTPEAALRAKNKNLMRECFARHGVPSPAYLFWARNSPIPLPGFLPPWVVKPTDSMGARGVQLVEDPAGLGLALEEAVSFSRTGVAVVEEFIPGLEFSIDALVKDNEIVVQGLADRDIRFPPRFIEMGHRFPTVLGPEEKNRLIQTFRQGVKALGLTHGAAKGDVKWHPTKGPMIGEIAARLSGGYMSGWTYPLSSGLSSIGQAISLALGDPVVLKGSDGPGWVAERALISIPGVLKEVQGLDKLKSMVGFREVFLNKNPGDPVVFPRNNVEKVGNYLLVGDQEEALNRSVHQAVRSLLVRLEPRNAKTDAWLADPTVPRAFPEGAETDYYGLTRQEVLDLFREVTGQDGRALGHKDKTFWDYLEKAGLQGAVYYWDSCSSQP